MVPLWCYSNQVAWYADTIRTVEGYSDIIVVRHFESGAARRAAATGLQPVFLLLMLVMVLDNIPSRYVPSFFLM